MSAILPSDKIPRGSSPSNIVVAGFLVAATKLAMGSTPNLWATILPINGSDVIGQLGLKSVAMEKGQSSLMHLFMGNSRLFPRTYGVPGRNVCTVPDSAALTLESSLEQAT